MFVYDAVLVIDSCSTGFMSLDVLEKRAEKIISSGIVNILPLNYLDREIRLVPGLKFNCSGNMASLMLGVDVRTVTEDRDEYPEVQVWREGPELSPGHIIYNKNAIQEIRLAVGDFSPDGVLQYNLTTPIEFHSGDILGVYQPPQDESVVRLFYANDPDATITYYRGGSDPNTNDMIIIHVENSPSKVNESMLVIPITGILDCFICIMHNDYYHA